MPLGFYDEPCCTLEASLEEVGTDCTPEPERVEIQGRVYEKATEAYAKLLPDLSPVSGVMREFVPPKLVEDFRWQRKVLGICQPLQGEVRLNMRLLCDAESYEQTLGHEVAHYVQYMILLARFGRWDKMPRSVAAPHGPLWSRVMDAMGYKPEVKGQADIAAAYSKTYAGMECSCGRKHAMGRRKLSNVAKKNGWFVCQCGKKLEPGEFKGC